MRAADRTFYLQGTVRLARELLGALLVSDIGGRTSGVIVETEAYLGPRDLASHCARGGPASRIFYQVGGTSYVYRIHQVHCFNIVSQPEDKPGAVLIRALEPKEGIELMAERRGVRPDQIRLLCSGPGRLAQALGINLTHNALDLLAAPIRLFLPPKTPGKIRVGKRIGISKDADRLLRFVLAGSRFVSKPI